MDKRYKPIGGMFQGVRGNTVEGGPDNASKIIKLDTDGQVDHSCLDQTIDAIVAQAVAAAVGDRISNIEDTVAGLGNSLEETNTKAFSPEWEGSLQSQIDGNNGSIESLSSRVTTLEDDTSVETLAGRVSTVEDRVSALTTQEENLSDRITSLQNTVGDSSSGLVKDVAGAVTAASAAQAAASNAQTIANAAQAKADTAYDLALGAAGEGVGERLDALESDVRALKDKVNDEDAGIDALAARTNELELNDTALDARIDTVSSREDSAESAISGLEDGLSALGGTVASQGETISSQGETISDHGSAIASQGASILAQGEAIAAQDSAIDSLGTRLTAVEGVVSNAATKAELEANYIDSSEMTQALAGYVTAEALAEMGYADSAEIGEMVAGKANASDIVFHKIFGTWVVPEAISDWVVEYNGHVWTLVKNGTGPIVQSSVGDPEALEFPVTVQGSPYTITRVLRGYTMGNQDSAELAVAAGVDAGGYATRKYVDDTINGIDFVDSAEMNDAIGGALEGYATREWASNNFLDSAELTTALDGYVPRPDTATEGNVAVFDGNKGISDSGMAIADLLDKSSIPQDQLSALASMEGLTDNDILHTTNEHINTLMNILKSLLGATQALIITAAALLTPAVFGRPLSQMAGTNEVYTAGEVDELVYTQALSRAEAEAGFTEWNIYGSYYNDDPIYGLSLQPEGTGWIILYNGNSIEPSIGKGDSSSERLYWSNPPIGEQGDQQLPSEWSQVVATRIRLRPTPEMEESWNAKASADDMRLTPVSNETAVIGYTLGGQTNSVLASTNFINTATNIVDLSEYATTNYVNDKISTTIDGVDELQWKIWFPEGNITSYDQCTTNLKYRIVDGTKNAEILAFARSVGASDDNIDNFNVVGDVVIPPYIYTNDTRFTVTAIDSSLLLIPSNIKENTNLVSVIAPTTVKTIGSTVFANCTALKTISFPGTTRVNLRGLYGTRSLDSSLLMSSLDEIQGHSFRGSGLMSIDAAATRIGTYAFADCTNLYSMSFPLVTNIATYAFENDVNLKYIDLPSCKLINNYAFNGCTNLSVINFGTVKERPAVYGNTFGTVNNCRVIVPDDLFTSWTNTPPWRSMSTWGYVFTKASEWEYLRKCDVQSVFSEDNAPEYMYLKSNGDTYRISIENGSLSVTNLTLQVQ